MSQELRLIKIDQKKNYLLEKIKQNELMSRNYKKVCTTRNCLGNLLILASISTEYIFAFASLFDVFIEITCSAIGLIICAIAAGIKKRKWIINIKKIKYDKTVSLAKSK